MRVIGTAGHVDHGKTTLIAAMTGMNPDRLPEEKARGMTIDLGFAWFTPEGGEPIGVIDVPGHERFIRNMVAGAWSLDCALLLVAADDGWMQQSWDHAVVLARLEVPAVILVVTKTDAAAPERVEAVRRDALKRCRGLFGAEPPCVDVSALSGRNVTELKDVISRTLAGLPAPAEPGFPYLYVDRVFTLKGSGLIVTGSLKGAALARDDELELLPHRERVRVRGLQSYNTVVEAARPTSRVALNLARPKAEIRRGDCLTAAGAPFSCETVLFARVSPLEPEPGRDTAESEAPEKPAIKNHSEIEIALGTTHRIAEIHFLDDRRFARIVLREAIPALWGQVFLIIRHGGSAILGSGRVAWAGDVARQDRGRLCGVLATLPDPVREGDRFSLELRFLGLVRLTRGLPEPAGADTVVSGEWAFHAPWLERLEAGVLELAGQPGGASPRELAGKLRLDEAALEAALPLIAQRRELVVRKGLYFAAGSGDSGLAGPARQLLAEMAKLGRTGFEPARREGEQRELNTLVRIGMVVPLEGGIYYTEGMYRTLASDILAGRRKGDRFTVPQAKERTGLSRKYTLPILNRMEKDGLLKREGDVRVVVEGGAGAARTGGQTWNGGS